LEFNDFSCLQKNLNSGFRVWSLGFRVSGLGVRGERAVRNSSGATVQPYASASQQKGHEPCASAFLQKAYEPYASASRKTGYKPYASASQQTGHEAAYTNVPHRSPLILW